MYLFIILKPTQNLSDISCLRFADVLSDNGRLTLTGDVITAFGKMMSAHRGEVICSVTTAQVENGWSCMIRSCIIV